MVGGLRRAMQGVTSVTVIVKHSIFYLSSLISHLFPYNISNVPSLMTCGSVRALLCIQVSGLLLPHVPGVYSSLPHQDILFCLCVWYVTVFPFYVFRKGQLFFGMHSICDIFMSLKHPHLIFPPRTVYFYCEYCF